MASNLKTNVILPPPRLKATRYSAPKKFKKAMFPTRKTLVKKEGWPCLGGWYLRSNTNIEQFLTAQEELYMKQGTVSFRYHGVLSSLHMRLAHACKDGKIRAPINCTVYRKKNGTKTFYGECAKCKVKLSNELKAVLIMEEL